MCFPGIFSKIAKTKKLWIETLQCSGARYSATGTRLTETDSGKEYSYKAPLIDNIWISWRPNPMTRHLDQNIIYKCYHSNSTVLSVHCYNGDGEFGSYAICMKNLGLTTEYPEFFAISPWTTAIYAYAGRQIRLCSHQVREQRTNEPFRLKQKRCVCFFW
jgi:hypothetical protein